MVLFWRIGLNLQRGMQFLPPPNQPYSPNEKEKLKRYCFMILFLVPRNSCEGVLQKEGIKMWDSGRQRNKQAVGADALGQIRSVLSL